MIPMNIRPKRIMTLSQIIKNQEVNVITPPPDNFLYEVYHIKDVSSYQKKFINVWYDDLFLSGNYHHEEANYSKSMTQKA
jgi:hypothetical protein